MDPEIKKEEGEQLLINPDLIEVENLVFTCNLNHMVNLRYVSSRLKGRAGFNPKKFAAVIIRFSDPKIAVLVFSPGKMVCTGSKTQNQAIYIINYVVDWLKEIGYTRIFIESFKIQNTVCTARLGIPIDCDSLASEKSGECNYEPDLFPGVVMRYEPIRPVTALIFKSGKIVLTGAKSEIDARFHLNTIYNIIYKYIHPHINTQGSIFGQRISVINTLAKEEISEKMIKSEIVKDEIIQVKKEFIESESASDSNYSNIPMPALVPVKEKEYRKSSIVERKHVVSIPIKRIAQVQKPKENASKCIYCSKWCLRKESETSFENICCICLHSKDDIHKAKENNRLCDW